MTQSGDAMKKLYSHIQILTQETAEVVDEDVLWEGLMRFVHEPEKFNDQVKSCTVTPGAVIGPVRSLIERLTSVRTASRRRCTSMNLHD